MIRFVDTFVFRILRHVIGISTLTLLCSVNVLAENVCATGASQVNPLAAVHSVDGDTTVNMAQSGIGGTGIQNGGIGGTGSKEGGIGGTGHMANDGGIGGTGIVGIITGFASICVNGVEIYYDPDTPVSVDGQSSTIHDLAVGQMVVVRADGTGNKVTARNIAVIHAVVGPVNSINSENGELQVLGQTIQVREQSDLEDIQINDWAQVSGHRLSNGTIVASRIELGQSFLEARINGHVTQIDTKGFLVNGARIEFDQQVRPADITLGTEISASGHWNNESLETPHLQIDPTRQNMGSVEHVVIEGYVHDVNNLEFNMADQIIKLTPDMQILSDERNDLNLNTLVQVSGRIDVDQFIIADHVESVGYTSPFILHEEIINIDSIDRDRGIIDIDESINNSNTDPLSDVIRQESNHVFPSASFVVEHMEQQLNDLSLPDGSILIEGPGDFDSFDISDGHLDLPENIDIPTDLNFIDRLDDHDMLDSDHEIHDWGDEMHHGKDHDDWHHDLDFDR